jgi:hypothetical protein
VRLAEIEPGRHRSPATSATVDLVVGARLDPLDETELLEVAEVVAARRRRLTDDGCALCRRGVADGQQQVQDRQSRRVGECGEHPNIGDLHSPGVSHGELQI